MCASAAAQARAAFESGEASTPTTILATGAPSRPTRSGGTLSWAGPPLSQDRALMVETVAEIPATCEDTDG
jgi:hypothetical protein